MKLSDRAEEILETLWIELVEHKKEKCDASMLKDDAGLKELVNLDCVRIKSNQLNLTDKGKVEAKSCVRRHRLAERLFVDVFDVKKKSAHEPSCKFEHLLHKGLDENICTLLGHPRRCPHGRPIPEGNCCRDTKRVPKKVIMPLAELEVNKKARVCHLQVQSRSALQKIIAIGALPNTELVLIQKFPSYVFKLGKSQFAIDKNLAAQIYVRAMQ
jgi:DtxR family Mn-dependent transcriptional regulator